MSFNWAEFISVAEYLSSKDTDAHLRSATSRAYYAAYNLARVTLEKHTGKELISNSTSHDTLWTIYSLLNTPEGTTIYDEGTKVKLFRKDADYSDITRDHRKAYNLARTRVDRIVSALSKVTKNEFDNADKLIACYLRSKQSTKR